METEILKLARKKNAMILFSNPSFEIWFLNHFVCHLKNCRSQKELIDELKRYIPEYGKSRDVYPMLPDIKTALRNSKKQCKEYSCLNHDCCGTDFYILMEKVLENCRCLPD